MQKHNWILQGTKILTVDGGLEIADLGALPWNFGEAQEIARLIVAAPKLLDACKMLAGVHSWAERHRKRNILDCCEWSVLHAAIAIVEGGNSK